MAESSMLNIRITPRTLLSRAFSEFDCTWAISIQDAFDIADPTETPNGIDPSQHAHFFFDDIRDEFDPPYPFGRSSPIIRAVPPKLSDVRSIIEFGLSIPSKSNVLIHCHAGISRSTASAFVIHVARGLSIPGAMRAMLDGSVQPEVVRPNELIVKHADDILGAKGALTKFLEEWKYENSDRYFF